MNYIGIDIGGTKCAVSLGCSDGQGSVRILHKCPKRLTEKRAPDLALIMPKDETYRIQEDHLAVYHLLCAVVEYEMFDM